MSILFNKKSILLFALICIQIGMFGQENKAASSSVEMADALYQSGKIYVVISALVVIFAGIIAYLVMIDRKIGKLEKALKKD